MLICQYFSCMHMIHTDVYVIAGALFALIMMMASLFVLMYSMHDFLMGREDISMDAPGGTSSQH